MGLSEKGYSDRNVARELLAIKTPPVEKTPNPQKSDY